MNGAGRPSRSRRQQVARWVRRTPGFRAAVRHVLPRVRRNATLTDVAWRVFLPQHGPGTLPVPLHGGRYLTGRDAVLLPVVGILGVGLDEQQVEDLIEQVAALQRAQLSFRPLLVLDRPAFGPARRHGYVVELVVPRCAWDEQPHADGRQGAGTGWEDYVGRRLADIMYHYQLWHLARAGTDGIDPLDRMVVTALAARLPPGLDVHWDEGPGIP